MFFWARGSFATFKLNDQAAVHPVSQALRFGVWDMLGVCQHGHTQFNGLFGLFGSRPRSKNRSTFFSRVDQLSLRVRGLIGRFRGGLCFDVWSRFFSPMWLWVNNRTPKWVALENGNLDLKLPSWWLSIFTHALESGGLLHLPYASRVE